MPARGHRPPEVTARGFRLWSPMHGHTEGRPRPLVPRQTARSPVAPCPGHNPRVTCAQPTGDTVRRPAKSTHKLCTGHVPGCPGRPPLTQARTPTRERAQSAESPRCRHALRCATRHTPFLGIHTKTAASPSARTRCARKKPRHERHTTRRSRGLPGRHSPSGAIRTHCCPKNGQSNKGPGATGPPLNTRLSSTELSTGFVDNCRARISRRSDFRRMAREHEMTFINRSAAHRNSAYLPFSTRHALVTPAFAKRTETVASRIPFVACGPSRRCALRATIG